MADESRRPVGDDENRPTAGKQPVTFSAAGARDGFVACLPIALGVASYGVVFGVLATQAGLSAAEATLMSATVLAGAAQLIAVELWADPVPVAAVLLTTLLVNLRYVVMGAALRPWFEDLSARAAYGSAFFTADENWALTMRELTDGGRRGAYLLGSGLAIWVCWIGATVVGATAGSGIGDPARYGLDFVFAAVFVAIAAGLWEGPKTRRPWAVAAVTAAASAHLLPGRWYVLVGAGVGCLVGVAALEEPAEQADRADPGEGADRTDAGDSRE
ncbi:AzlC family ABC transporter permease [Natrinema versiforme]|uniref:AzlC family protein n=1 Tax=Natrinema versiforme JCM 10478 TaxID=1227496 RepID=L9YCN4_9EURY|nr:AzlC family ABC transporter permease [Natrinema versiforme]ELY71386.1 AzlC family protein [Natrinema versiforme JCM 10478]